MKSDTTEERSIASGVKYSKELTILARVKTLLDMRGLSQAQLAGRLGISRQYLNGVLHKRMTMPVRMKVRMAKELGVDSSVIWPLDDEDEEEDWNPDYPYKELNGKREEDDDS